MTYRVRLSSKAMKAYKAADVTLAKKLARCFEVLEQTPRQHPNLTPLRGNLAGRYRYRAGDYRVMYRIDDERQEVIVLLIKHRRDIYE
ncbi:MAG: type II toxin-antitoxin system RelE/ParE family toxin [Leptolyngbyaceae bacterium]|nr:type II toxin-antitoxin system RelE/ParE family toxin [Leptolyngbyaceae bacterium]